ncbi:HNH endonuclease [Sphingosinicella sp. BN140058]|uniref:HNH endonuclease n=1 Tax=Sphingosinicella sp. BN140058 TaxID=1892855 RepID=UPI00197E7F81|nr:HNH endonuclease [Sphingosinicella sp. BN140058]
MGRLTAFGGRLQPLAPKVKAPIKVVEPFYQSKAWRELVARIKRERGNHCERCGSTKRVIADHKQERKDGGADLDPANIELLCFDHHQRKTAKARAARALGGQGTGGHQKSGSPSGS